MATPLWAGVVCWGDVPRNFHVPACQVENEDHTLSQRQSIALAVGIFRNPFTGPAARSWNPAGSGA